ncbi:hypothetical protein [Primorskyibacter flagellatus]|uniref:hypothetical protein n=1 Tax=Primorskyibacter flagellatus TaxID=1387277 RepID=UPI003A8F61E7
MAPNLKEQRDLLYLAALYERYGHDDAAARCIARAMRTMTPDPEYVEGDQVNRLASFGDQLCRRLSKRDAYILPEQRPDDKTVMLLATQLYPTGGHTALVSNFVRANGDRRVIILVTQFDGGETDLNTVNWKYPGLTDSNVEVILLDPAKTLPEAIGDVLWVARENRPSEIHLFNHPHDVAAVTAVAAINRGRKEPKKTILKRMQRRTSPDVFFYHHADIRPTLGLAQPGCIYLAHKRSMVDDFALPGSRGKHYIPLSPATFTHEMPALTAVQETALADAGFISVSIGNRIKFFPPFSYPVKYKEIVSQLLLRDDSVHVHIGDLYPADLIAIREELRRHTIDEDRFLHIAFYPSLATFLKKYAADLFVCTFPIGGGMSLIEALSHGIAVAAHNQPFEAFSELVYCPPGVMIWDTPDELGQLVANLDETRLKMFRNQAKEHFAKEFGYDVFRTALANAVKADHHSPDIPSDPDHKLQQTEVDWLVNLVKRSCSPKFHKQDIKATLTTITQEAHVPGDNLSVYFDDDFYRLFVLEDDSYWNAPLLHYLRVGHMRGLQPHPLLEPDWLADSGTPPEGTDLLTWYAQRNHADPAHTHPLFDGARYFESSPDVRDAAIDPLRHYLEYGYAEFLGSRIYCTLIDRALFSHNCGQTLTQVPDLLYYLYSPDAAQKTHTAFDPNFYRHIARPPANAKALLHYYRHGMSEGLDFHAMVSNDFLSRQHGFRINSSAALNMFFHEWKTMGEHINPHPLFDTAFVLQQYPHLWQEPLHPLTYYLAGRGGDQPRSDFVASAIKTRAQWETEGRSTMESFARDGFQHRLRLPDAHPLRDAVELQLSRAISEGDSAMADAITGAHTRFPFAKGATKHFANTLLTRWRTYTPAPSRIYPSKIPAAPQPAFFDKPRSLGWAYFATHTTRNQSQPIHIHEMNKVAVVGGYPGVIDLETNEILLPQAPNQSQKTPWPEDLIGVEAQGDCVRWSYADVGTETISHGVLLRTANEPQGNWAIDVIGSLMALLETGLPPRARLLVDETMDSRCIEVLRRLCDNRITILRRGHVTNVTRLTIVTPPVAYVNAPDKGKGEETDSFLNMDALQAARNVLQATYINRPQSKRPSDLVLSKSGVPSWITNWHDVSTLFGASGFDTETLAHRSIADTAQLIGDARTLVICEAELAGPALMLARPGTRIYLISNLDDSQDHNSWHNIATLFGLDLQWIPCATLINPTSGTATLPPILYKAVINHRFS